jgi:outer membrane protein assembly factor BamB
MKPYLILFLAPLVLLIHSCKKETLPPIPYPSDKDFHKKVVKYQPIWQIPLHPDTSFVYYNVNHLEDDILVIGGMNQDQAYYKGIDVRTQEVLWEHINPSLGRYSNPLFAKGKVYLQSSGYFVCLDRATGELEMEVKLPSIEFANIFGIILGDHHYQCFRYRDNSKAWIGRSSLDDLTKWDTLYAIRRGVDIGQSRPNIQSFNLWIHPESQDSILLFQHRMSMPNRVDVVAWNLSKKRVLWKRENLTSLGNSTASQMNVINNKTYFMGGTALHCLDLFTGKTLWQWDHPSGINGLILTQPLYDPDRNVLFVRDMVTELRAFDPETGEVLWHNKDTGANNSDLGQMSLFNDVIYFTNDAKLWAVDALNGETIWEEPTYYSTINYRFTSGVSIDTQRNLLYTSDQQWLYGIPLPR